MAVKMRLIGQKAMNKIISQQPEVQDEVKSQAKRLGAIAKSALAGHYNTGDHKIEIKKNLHKKYGFLDYEISLVGSAPLSVEFGHMNHRGGYVHGLYILSRLL
jgi:hypothetical protein